MDDWSNRTEYFRCSKCVHQEDGTYDFKEALARLDDTLTDGFDSFLVTGAAEREQLLLDTYQVTLPPKSPKMSLHVHPLCNTAVEILKRYQPSVLEYYTPISVQGDGNCFYRALSLAFWGTQEHHEQLRLRITIEMMLHRDHYDCECDSETFKLPQPEIVTPKYPQVLKTAAGWGRFAEMVHFLAASVVIGEPLVSFFPMKGINPQAKAYTMTITGRGVRANKKSRATLMWSRITVPSGDDNGYTPNHFVFLNEKPWASLRNSPPMKINDESDHEVKTSHITDEMADEEDIVNEKYVKKENLKAETSETDVDNMSVPTTELGTEASEVNLLSGGYPLVTGTFLHPKEVLKLLREPNTTPLVAVPAGLKENIYFIIDNTKNCDLKARGHNCDYRDDCGAWLSKKGTSPKALYAEYNGVFMSVVKSDRLYCLYRKPKRYIPLDPQPAESEVTVLQRNYATLKADTNYRRRISWLINSKQKLAVVEYVCKFPGQHAHRSEKVQDDAPDYIRTNPPTLEKNSDSAKHKTPLHPDDSMIQHDDASHQMHLVSESRTQPQATEKEDYSMQEEIPCSDQLVLSSNPASISDMQIEPAPTLTVQTETVSVPTIQATGKIPDPLMQVEQTPIRTQQIELPPTTSMQNLPIITNREPSPVNAVCSTETPQAYGLDLTMQRNLTPKHALYLPMKEAPQCHTLGLTMETTTSSDHTPSLAVQKKTHHTHSSDSVMQAETSHAYTLGSTMPKEPPSANVIPSTMHTKPCPSNTHSTMQDNSFFPGMDQFHPARMTGPTLQQEILPDLESPGHSISRSLPSTTFVQASPHSAQSNPSMCDALLPQSRGTTTSQITSHVPPHPDHSIPLSIPPYSFPVQQPGYIPYKSGKYPQMPLSVNMPRSQRATTEKVKLRVLSQFTLPPGGGYLSFGQQLDFLRSVANNPTVMSYYQYTGTCVSEVNKKPFPHGNIYHCNKFITQQRVVLQSIWNVLSIYNHELQHIKTVRSLGYVIGLISDSYALVMKPFITHQGLPAATVCITPFPNPQEIHHEVELPHPKAYDVNDNLLACGLLDHRVAVTKKFGPYVDFYNTVGHHIRRFDLDGCTGWPRCTAQHVLVPIRNQPRTILMFTWSGELIQLLEPLGLDLYDKCITLSPVHDRKLNIHVGNAPKATHEIITCEIQECEEHNDEMIEYR